MGFCGFLEIKPTSLVVADGATNPSIAQASAVEMREPFRAQGLQVTGAGLLPSGLLVAWAGIRAQGDAICGSDAGARKDCGFQGRRSPAFGRVVSPGPQRKQLESHRVQG